MPPVRSLLISFGCESEALRFTGRSSFATDTSKRKTPITKIYLALYFLSWIRFSVVARWLNYPAAAKAPTHDNKSNQPGRWSMSIRKVS